MNYSKYGVDRFILDINPLIYTLHITLASKQIKSIVQTNCEKEGIH